MEKKQWEETAAFIREHRSNENNFSILYAKLEEVAGKADGDCKNRLKEIKEKGAVEYNAARSTGGTAWPEFENFVSSFEKTVIDAMNRS